MRLEGALISTMSRIDHLQVFGFSFTATAHPVRSDVPTTVILLIKTKSCSDRHTLLIF